MELFHDFNLESPEKAVKRLKRQAARLIEERDSLLYHSAKTLEAEYMSKIGYLQYELFALQGHAMKTKRKIEFINALKRNNKPVDVDKIDRFLDREYRPFHQRMSSMAYEVVQARTMLSSPYLNPSDVEFLRTSYISLVEVLHPDLNPSAPSEHDVLWERAADAYDACDLDMMRTVTELYGDSEKEELPTDPVQLEQERKRLLGIVRNLFNEIEKIRGDFPFSIAEALFDTSYISEQRKDISDQIAETQALCDKLSDELKSTL
ncbi:MAG: hypothetical protein E7491_02610 [Ruminococcaceae bacterium]|nr:hypothetical protein [Oscillospiraceae bacterium]